MLIRRNYAAASQLKDGNLLVTGGYDGPEYLNSTEMLTEGGWESRLPPLPFTIAHHCMLTVNSTTVIVIGGTQNDQISGRTFYFTFGAETWTKGPELKFKRGYHSCGRIIRSKESQEMSIVVAGGKDDFFLSSVEILDIDSNEWRHGPELSIAICQSQMVEDPNGGAILIGGRSPSNDYLDTLFQLPHGGQDAVWTKMEQTLKIGRHAHTAFLVADNIVDCS